MAQITWFAALPIVSTEDGFAGVEVTQCPSAESARRKASALAQKHGGAVAFSRSCPTLTRRLQREGSRLKCRRSRGINYLLTKNSLRGGQNRPITKE